MEIGGYLEFEHNYGSEYHKNCIKLNTARNCLKYLLIARNIKKIWISRWNCSAVLDTCQESGVQICFYDLDLAFRPILPKAFKPDDYIYVVNYYGQISEYYQKNIIWDNVQAFFQKPIKGVDTIYTCRKFFGVSDGAYLYTDRKIEREFEYDESVQRITYLAGRFEKTGQDYYEAYQKNEKILDNQPIKRMSKFTENILRGLDYKSIKKKREDNFYFLHEKLGKYNMMDVHCPQGPFAYPLKIKDGMSVRTELQKRKIYIAKLWPNVTDGYEKELADNILPLPCDQRYSLETMKVLVKEIVKCL